MVDLLAVAIRGDLKAAMKDERRALERAATTSVRQTTYASRKGIQRMVEKSLSANSGVELRVLVGASVKPRRGVSLNAEGFIFSRAWYKRAGGITDLLQVWDNRTVIVPQQGKFLAIPTDDAPRRGGRPVAPEDIKGRLVFIPAKGESRRNPQKAYLLNRERTAIYFVLVKEIVLKKKIDIDKIHSRESAKLETRFHKVLEREDRKLEAKYGR